MAIIWEDLPNRKNCFTVRNALLWDLSKNKIIRQYLANTKIQVVQKANYNGHTYYRTETPALKGLDWAFEAASFGLPDEIAPLEPSLKSDSLSHSIISRKPKKLTPPTSARKQTLNPKAKAPKNGEGKRHMSWLSRIFRRKNG